MFMTPAAQRRLELWRLLEKSGEAAGKATHRRAAGFLLEATESRSRMRLVHVALPAASPDFSRRRLSSRRRWATVLTQIARGRAAVSTASASTRTKPAIASSSSSTARSPSPFDEIHANGAVCYFHRAGHSGLKKS
eukprot:gene13012-9309_t